MLEKWKWVTVVFGEVLIDSAQGGDGVEHTVLIAGRSGDDLRDREPELLKQIIDEQDRAACSRAVAWEGQNRVYIVEA